MKQSKSRAAFNEAYASLNAAQKEAVDTIEGPVMVVAGPGTGKTQILTLRIANILLSTDTAPESILALTFTESGAKAMRERLRRYIGTEAYRVSIFTFHGFAGQLIREYPDAYARIIGGRPASDIEKIAIIESILESGSYKALRPMGQPTYYVTPILRTIGTLKQEYLTPERFAEIIVRQERDLEGIEKIHQKGAHKGKVRGEYANTEKKIIKNKELLQVYRLYEQLLGEQRLFDFDDMIAQTVAALETNEDMLRDLQERYQYILADEHQDVNGSQNRILELLAHFHDAPNIFAVGDEKQAIYRFQGASLENFLYFEDLFPKTKTIALIENYRSGQEILDAAHALVAVEDGPLSELRVPLVAKAVATSAVTHHHFTHQAIEDAFVVEKIQELILTGMPPQEIAIIVRTNREVEAYASLLRKAGLAVTASADGDILQHPITQSVRSLIAAIVAAEDALALFKILHDPYWGIATSDLVKVCAAQTYDRPLTALIADKQLLIELGVSAPDVVHNVHTILEEARAREVHEAPHHVLEYVLQASGFIDHVMSRDPFEGARVIRRLYDEIEEMVRRDGVGTLREVLRVFTTAESYGLPLNAPYVATSAASIQVMTAHKSKGLEFTAVFAPHLQDSTWGGAVRRQLFAIPLTKHLTTDDFDVLDDERRLLYVVMTRAKTHLFLSSAETNADGKELQVTRLLAIDEGLYVSVVTDDIERVFDPLAVVRTELKAVNIEPTLLTHLLAQRGFSATSLNNYLRSPWDYVYRNILRIPEVQPVHMQFGTAVHNTLEYITRTNTQTGAMPSDTAVKSKIETELGRLPLTTGDFSRLLERALEVLYGYMQHLQMTLPQETKEELVVRVMLPTGLPDLPEVPLTGKLDRLDLENGQALRVVDYKTGKPKSRNVIEGKTATSDGGYKRQLVFYALLLDLYDDERYRTSTGTLSFVEGDGKGNIKEETFTITQEEIADLKETIIGAVADIVSGKSLQVTCDEKTSEYCHLVELLKNTS